MTVRYTREYEFVAASVCLDNCAFYSGEPVFDVADRPLDIADQGFGAQRAVVPEGISDVNGDRVA